MSTQNEIEIKKVFTIPSDLLAALLDPNQVVKLCGESKCEHSQCEVRLAWDEKTLFSKDEERKQLKRKLDEMEKSGSLHKKSKTNQKVVYGVSHDNLYDGRQETETLDEVFDTEQEATQFAVESMIEFLYENDRIDDDQRKEFKAKAKDDESQKTLLSELNDITSEQDGEGWDETCVVVKLTRSTKPKIET